MNHGQRLRLREENDRSRPVPAEGPIMNHGQHLHLWEDPS